MSIPPQPEPFLQLVVHDLDLDPPLSALCAGYELGDWRSKQLAGHLIEWLPQFSLSHSELEGFNHATAIRLMRRAAFAVYNTEKYGKRGEFGELLLHAILRQVIGTIPAIAKIYFKDAANDTVKGFDAVHVVPHNEGLQLWLGEAKFYKDLSHAITDAVASIKEHLQPDYLRAEFHAITNKIDSSWPHADQLRKLLDPNTSLDQIFSAICVPVLLTYDSNAVASFTQTCEDYFSAFELEVRRAQQAFSAKALPCKVELHLFLTPLGSKDSLVSALHERLKAWQAG